MFFLEGALVCDVEGGGGEEFLLGFAYKQTGDRRGVGKKKKKERGRRGGLEETVPHPLPYLQGSLGVDCPGFLFS